MTAQFNKFISILITRMISISFTTLAIWILAACNSSSEPAEPQKEVPSVNVMTYNIHHGNPPTREAGYIDLTTIARTIHKVEPDLVALQELDSVTTRSGKKFQLGALAELLEMHYYYGKAINYQGGGYGVGILSRYPIIEARTVELPNIEGFVGEDRVLALVKVALPGDQEIWFGSTHLDVTTEANRVLQAKEIVSVAKALDAPMIVGGDFNATEEKAPMQELYKHFTDASTKKEPTVPVLQPSRRIDYILYAGADDFSVLKEEVLTKDNYGSDHLAFWAKLGYRE